MTYYVAKVFWLLVAPTSALILTSAIAGVWAVLRGSRCAAWLAAAASCVLVIGAFTPIGLALKVPLENRFAFSPPDSPPAGIILLSGSGSSISGIGGINAMSELSQDYRKARLIFSGFSATDAADKYRIKIFALLGGDLTRINIIEPLPRTTSEDALYSAAFLKPKPDERWLLVTTALHMTRAVGCFRTAGFQVEPYPVEFSQTHPFGTFAPTRSLNDLDVAAKEWIGLVAYRLMGKTDVLFPAP